MKWRTIKHLCSYEALYPVKHGERRGNIAVIWKFKVEYIWVTFFELNRQTNSENISNLGNLRASTCHAVLVH